MNQNESEKAHIINALNVCWAKERLLADRIEITTVPLPDRTKVLCVNFSPASEVEHDTDRIKAMIRQLVVFIINTRLSIGCNGFQSAVNVHVPDGSGTRLYIRWKFWVNANKLRDLEKKSRKDMDILPLESLISGSFESPFPEITLRQSEAAGATLPLPR